MVVFMTYQRCTAGAVSTSLVPSSARHMAPARDHYFLSMQERRQKLWNHELEFFSGRHHRRQGLHTQRNPR